MSINNFFAVKNKLLIYKKEISWFLILHSLSVFVFSALYEKLFPGEDDNYVLFFLTLLIPGLTLASIFRYKIAKKEKERTK